MSSFIILLLAVLGPVLATQPDAIIFPDEEATSRPMNRTTSDEEVKPRFGFNTGGVSATGSFGVQPQGGGLSASGSFSSSYGNQGPFQGHGGSQSQSFNVNLGPGGVSGSQSSSQASSFNAQLPGFYGGSPSFSGSQASSQSSGFSGSSPGGLGFGASGSEAGSQSSGFSGNFGGPSREGGHSHEFPTNRHETRNPVFGEGGLTHVFPPKHPETRNPGFGAGGLTHILPSRRPQTLNPIFGGDLDQFLPLELIRGRHPQMRGRQYGVYSGISFRNV